MEVEEPKSEQAVVEEEPEPVRETEIHKEGSERLASEWQPYGYAEMLEMIYERMRKRGSCMFARGGTCVTQFVVQPPQVIRLGTKKSGFANFGAIAKSIGREQSHLQRYLDVELGTTSRLDGAGILVLKGKHGRGEVESVFKGYIKEYVRCRTCGEHSTRFERHWATRLDFLVCNECSARSSVTEKRSRIRWRENP
jgi:translation initiation factor 2 subunit 2